MAPFIAALLAGARFGLSKLPTLARYGANAVAVNTTGNILEYLTSLADDDKGRFLGVIPQEYVNLGIAAYDGNLYKKGAVKLANWYNKHPDLWKQATTKTRKAIQEVVDTYVHNQSKAANLATLIPEVNDGLKRYYIDAKAESDYKNLLLKNSLQITPQFSREDTQNLLNQDLFPISQEAKDAGRVSELLTPITQTVDVVANPLEWFKAANAYAEDHMYDTMEE